MGTLKLAGRGKRLTRSRIMSSHFVIDFPPGAKEQGLDNEIGPHLFLLTLQLADWDWSVADLV